MEIYNAEALDLAKNFTAKIAMESDPTVFTPLTNEAIYDSYTNRLVWEAASPTEVSLLKAAVIQFTYSVPPPPPPSKDDE